MADVSADRKEIVIDLDLLGAGPTNRIRTGDGDGRRVPDDGIPGGIRQDAFRRVVAKLAAKPTEMPEPENAYAQRPQSLDVMPNRSHDAILISARRGDGKTTFLVDLLTLIQNNYNRKSNFRHYLDENTSNDQIGNLYSLGIVDPTLIEAKQHIVVIIIEKIKTAVDHVHERHPDKAAYDGFRERLYDLASGLTLLDGIGEAMLQGKDWADPDYILDKGLDRAGAAGGFERAFRRFVHEACKYLQVDAFVLAIDDVDTSFEQGSPVLEALRKYLAAPQLKVVLAGDLKLYNLLVRRQQWTHISREFVDLERASPTDRSYHDQIVKMVDVLQDQYLIKIARPENRVELRNLLHYADKHELKFIASKRRTNVKLSERDAVAHYANRLFALGGAEEQAIIRSTLLRLPLRSSLQALAGAWPLISGEQAESDPERPPSPGPRPVDLQPEWTRDALDALRSIASQSLMTLDLDHETLLEADPDQIFGALSQWMSQKELWRKAARFFPNGEAESDDLVALLIAGTLTSLFRNRPHAMIDYWLKICTIRELIDRRDISPQGIREILRDHFKIALNESAIQFVSRLSAWELTEGGPSRSSIRLSGIGIPATLSLGRARQQVYTEQLYGLGDNFDRETFSRTADNFRSGRRSGLNVNQKKLIDALPVPLQEYHRALMTAGWGYKSRRKSEAGLTAIFVNSLDSMERRLPQDIAAVAMIPAARATNDQLAANTTYSILRLIAFLGELLAIGSRTTGSDRRKAITDHLYHFSLLRSYPSPLAVAAPVTGTRAAPAVDDDAPEEPEDDQDEASGDDDTPSPAGDGAQEDEQAKPDSTKPSVAERQPLVDALDIWLDTVTKEPHPAISAITLARIWTRFTYAFDGVGEELQHTKTRYLGVVMHRAIIVFLHAVGVEALKAAGHAPTTKTIRNPVASSEALHEVVEKIYPGDETVSLDKHKLWVFDSIFTCPIWGFFLARRDDQIQNGKIYYTDKIYDKYIDIMSKKSIEPNYDVYFTSTAGKIGAKFDGLHSVLNTIPIQVGRRTTNSSVALNLAATLKELALYRPPPIPRTVSRPSPRPIVDKPSPDSTT